MTILNKHILIIEDDKRLNQMMSDMLFNEGYQVNSIFDGLSAIAAIKNHNPDIILLDMMLPGCDGLDVLRNIPQGFAGIIFMITAKQDEFLEVSALNLGVHDYIEKPIRPHILLAKIKALSRLNENSCATHSDLIKVQDLKININSRQLFLSDTLIDVTEAEYEIMLYFMRNPGDILNREMIIKEIRNIEYDGLDRSIDMRVSSLRKKLFDTKPPYKYIKTIRAKGYILPR
ncbi:response regulator transcription factor [Pseudoalteromonas denitrificans]|uniref:Two-component system, OmpR family, response regulator RstA n=1 Tax=Pseudoalteromonas denitrificans DSM 6059 TaxID=1123010 RepID=A0A1I1PI81_9GAMM|nr:response regulator transcription factor [Pseudoalteromonas denitrificans]SFD09499.1 two-component system, OmpR family, response regulator RstA [Pseudoalteromonas denitrificans DSM 6059]